MPALIDSLARLSATERARALKAMPADELVALEHDWRAWARDAQLPPAWGWAVWLILAGRGFGKTRTGAEFVREEVRAGRARRVALVGPTAADVRDVMVRGESGLLNVGPDKERPAYQPSLRLLTWANGAQATLYSAEEPDRLRGPQHDLAWADEIAAWQRAQETWDMLLFGLRLGERPRVLATTTPRPIPLVKRLLADPTTAVTRGTTYDNRANLPDSFFTQIIARYEGTRLGRQELAGEVLDDVPGALWTHALVERARVPQAPPALRRVVVAIDPAVTSSEDSDETGIIVAGVARHPDGIDHGYVLDDRSGRVPAIEWARRAVAAYRDFRADRIVAEVNNGGDLVESQLRVVDRSVSYRAVHASRGKRVRAEPVAALYEQGRVHHVGGFAALEDQMCVATGTLVTTLRGDVPVERVVAGDIAFTRAGWRRVLWAGQTGEQRTLTIRTSDGRTLRATEHHPIFVHDIDFVLCCDLMPGVRLLSCQPQLSPRSWNSPASGITATPETGTTRRAAAAADVCSTVTCGPPLTVTFPPVGTFTTSTEIAATTTWRTCAPCLSASTFASIRAGALPPSWSQRTGSEPPPTGPRSRTAPSGAPSAAPNSRRAGSAPACTAGPTVVSVTGPSFAPEPVYNLSVSGQPEFFANGLLVHNCGYVPDGGGESPDRVDALVWALTDLMLTGPAPVALDASRWARTMARG